MPTDVETLMTAWQDAWFTKNGRAIAEMMTDDYIYVAPNGAVMDRATILGVVNDPDVRDHGGHAHRDGSEHARRGRSNGAASVARQWDISGSGVRRGSPMPHDLRSLRRSVAHSIRTVLGSGGVRVTSRADPIGLAIFHPPQAPVKPMVERSRSGGWAGWRI